MTVTAGDSQYRAGKQTNHVGVSQESAKANLEVDLNFRGRSLLMALACDDVLCQFSTSSFLIFKSN